MNDLPAGPIFSNSRIYRDIAVEALSASESAFSEGSRPKDDGSSGRVLVYDPEHRSFKQSMIAVVFAGMYIEARLWLHGSSRLGIAKYRSIDRQPLEDRLLALGVSDALLWDDLKDYRESRKSLVHEKPVPLSMDISPTRVAQTEAVKAVALMGRVDRAIADSAT